MTSLAEQTLAAPDPSDCPRCGEWRDSPIADCGSCGYDGVCRCGHDHCDPPWREEDGWDQCNATMGPMICGCSEFVEVAR
jgi:hypothetical protein